MRSFHSIVVVTSILLTATVPCEARGGTGRIEGRVERGDGSPVSGVVIVLEGTTSAEVTDTDGVFEFQRVRPGVHSLRFELAPYPVLRTEVTVADGSTTRVDRVVEWEVGYAETITVRAPSRGRERIVDAPAAVTTVGEEEIERQAIHNQVPKLFEFTPGVDITQISAVEFLVSTRGFNSPLNRRMAVLVDGRDITDPFVGATEWTTLSVPLDELSEVELVRGPTSALYGANATGGVVSMTTRSARDWPGGQVRLGAGNLDSSNVDFRWAGSLGRDWYLKAVASRQRTDGFSVSRFDSVEYGRPCDPLAVPPVVTDCLPLDNAMFPELPDDKIDVLEYNVRVDKVTGNGSALTLEYGTTEYEGPVFLNATGRGQLRDVQKPWARFSFTTDHWSLLGYYNGRDAEALNLNTAGPFLLDADNHAVELQTHWNLADNRVRVVGGGSYFKERVDSNALFAEEDTDQEALFFQVDWKPTEPLKVVGALRWDRSSLHDDRVSPKASLLYGITPRHTVRVSYNEGFQLPTYAEYFLYFPLFPVDLTSLETDVCQSAGYDCFPGATDSVPVGILGNEKLKLEETTAYEVGYKGVLGRKALVSIDLFESRNENFVTPLIPQISADGRTNPTYAPWEVPPAVEDDFRDALADLIPPGSELVDFQSTPFVLYLSNTTVGRVDTRGADVGLDYYFGDGWRFQATYSWLDFDLQSEVAANVAQVVQPNAPERKASVGFSHVAQRWNATIRGRWVDDFRWVNSATFEGTVDAFTTVDVSGNYALSKNWKVGMYVSNVFDDEHWETWGSDLLGRRALGYLLFSW